MKFEIKDHSVRPGVKVIEVFDNAGNFVASITPGDSENEIRLISKYLSHARVDGVPPEAIFMMPPYPGAASIYLHTRPPCPTCGCSHGRGKCPTPGCSCRDLPEAYR